MSCLRLFRNLKGTRLRPALLRPFAIGHSVRFASYTATIARYYEHGAVDKVLKIDEEELPPMGPNQIVVKMLASPLNPADFNMIEGVYSIRPPLPAVGGNEGVGVVLEKGDAVTSMNKGDWVIPAQPGFGTWRTYLVGNAADFMTVDNNIPKETAATIAVNPCTAYRMLNDFRKLNPGDVVIQNGANSAVGMCVIQIAKTMGVKTINVIRDRPDLAAVVYGMKELGADIVVTEEQLANTPVMTKMIADEMGADPVLGLNCVGGKSVAEVSRFLADKASLVTYGGMSRKPVTVPTGKLIFNDIHLRGFWLSRWTLEHSREERKQMIDAVTKLVRAGKLKQSFDPVSFPNIQEALSRVNAPQRNAKVIFTFA